MRSLLAAAVVAAVTFVPAAAYVSPADCLEPLIGRDYEAPKPVTRDEQGRIIVDPSAFDADVQRLVTAALCLT